MYDLELITKEKVLELFGDMVQYQRQYISEEQLNKRKEEFLLSIRKKEHKLQVLCDAALEIDSDKTISDYEARNILYSAVLDTLENYCDEEA